MKKYMTIGSFSKNEVRMILISLMVAAEDCERDDAVLALDYWKIYHRITLNVVEQYL